MHKLVAILPSNSRSEVWAVLEHRHGRNVLVLREQEAERGAHELRKPKSPIAIPISAIPKLRAALEAAEQELQGRGLISRQNARQQPKGVTGPNCGGREGGKP